MYPKTKPLAIKKLLGVIIGSPSWTNLEVVYTHYQRKMNQFECLGSGLNLAQG